MERVSGVKTVLTTEVVSRPNTVVETQVFPVSVSDVKHDAQVSPVLVLMLNTMPKFYQSWSQYQTQYPGFLSLCLDVNAKNLQHHPSTVVETLVSPVPAKTWSNLIPPKTVRKLALY